VNVNRHDTIWGSNMRFVHWIL